jgi:hypothetical protein
MAQPSQQTEESPAAPPSEEKQQAVPSARRAKLRSALDFLKSVSGAAGILTGLAFINGWLYWAVYYSAFGLNPIVLDFPIAVISVSPIWVFVRDFHTDPDPSIQKILVRALILCVTLAALFVYAYAHRYRYATLLLICMAILMSAGALDLGLHDALLDSSCQSRLPNVSLELNTHADPDAPPPACQQMDCKLLLHVGGVYHYLQSPDCSSTLGNGQLAMGEVLESEIKSVHINRLVGW